jgi:hypothetical protein
MTDSGVCGMSYAFHIREFVSEPRRPQMIYPIFLNGSMAIVTPRQGEESHFWISSIGIKNTIWYKSSNVSEEGTLPPSSGLSMPGKYASSMQWAACSVYSFELKMDAVKFLRNVDKLHGDTSQKTVTVMKIPNPMDCYSTHFQNVTSLIITSQTSGITLTCSSLLCGQLYTAPNPSSTSCGISSGQYSHRKI